MYRVAIIQMCTIGTWKTVKYKNSIRFFVAGWLETARCWSGIRHLSSMQSSWFWNLITPHNEVAII